jgi:CDP-glucose 4,6-dehydratase
MTDTVNPDFWRGKRVLITGHTGFKGGWLSLWLQSLGAELQGLALNPPTTPSLFVEAKVGSGMASALGDIRDYETVRACMLAFKPEITIHMAAQPLVRQSYAEPVDTYATNVMGTVHVLESVRHTPSVKAVVVVTTDKCYENKEWPWGYRENEPMGVVRELMSTGPQTVLVLEYLEDGKTLERMIPFVSVYVDSVDLQARRIVVDWQADY